MAFGWLLNLSVTISKARLPLGMKWVRIRRVAASKSGNLILESFSSALSLLYFFRFYGHIIYQRASLAPLDAISSTTRRVAALHVPHPTTTSLLPLYFDRPHSLSPFLRYHFPWNLTCTGHYHTTPILPLLRRGLHHTAIKRRLATRYSESPCFTVTKVSALCECGLQIWCADADM
jgi:hypothetical protein